MTLLSTQISPPNSVLLVLDPETGEVPTSMAGPSVAASPLGIAIGTLAGDDCVITGGAELGAGASFEPAHERHDE